MLSGSAGENGGLMGKRWFPILLVALLAGGAA